jgi:hypothetical protein
MKEDIMRFQFVTRWILRFVSTVLAILGIHAIAFSAGPPEDVLNMAHPRVRAVVDVQNGVTKDLMKSADVLGTAVGLDNDGNPSLVVYVDRDSDSVADTIRRLPARIRGTGVKVELTDKFVAYAKPAPVPTVSHTAKQTPPIKLGTSGGWGQDLANGYCCGGTLGALIQVYGTQYIMSNYHVFEADIVPGGNGIVANNGDPIIQPALIDVNCRVTNAQVVASLVKLAALPGHNVDVSVAVANPNIVSTDGAILEIGTISKNTVAATIKKGVKKSGRTTGLTSSTISGLNATISVTYEDECAGGTAFTKTFTGQVVVANKGNKFLNAGDSGSLLVENVATNPRAVGLLYAGSSTSAIANPIDEVLQFIGSVLGGTASMVGN